MGAAIRVRSWPFAFLLLATSCARPPAASVPQRLAILRFENLSQDPSLDWMGRAFPEVIWSELAAAPGLYTISPGRILTLDRTMGPRPVSAPGVSAEQSGAQAAGANRMGYGTYWISGGRLEARLTIEDSATLKNLQVLSASAPAGDLLAAAGALAQQISGRAGAYGTANPQALKDYATALEAADPSGMEAQASLAIAADPDFGPAYRLLVQVQSQRDREAALALAGQALSRAGIRPADRVRLEIEAATLRDDPGRAPAGTGRAGEARTGRYRDLAVAGPDRLCPPRFPRRHGSLAKGAGGGAGGCHRAEPARLCRRLCRRLYGCDLCFAPVRRAPAQRCQPARFARRHQPDRGTPERSREFYVQAVKKAPNFYGGADWFKAAMARLMTGDISGRG